MNYTEFFEEVQLLDKNKKIKQADIARWLETSTSNLSQKFSNKKSEVTLSDIEKFQKNSGINLFIKVNNSTMIVNNSKERQFDSNLCIKKSGFGNRILDIKNKNNLSEMKMAVLLNITEIELNNLISEKTKPDIELVDNIKQNFKVSVDWLLYGN